MCGETFNSNWYCTAVEIECADYGRFTVLNAVALQYTEKLTKALMKNTHCKFVSVAECCITDVGAKQFAAVLKSNSTIETLDLQKNKVHRPAWVVAEVSCVLLHRLCLQISNEGATAIAEALKVQSRKEVE